MSKSERERERQKAVQDKCMILLDELLRDDDNKYCVDCDAKGPRWASWNIGVFLCIRCAGIHRNLGVHISRVKSVNLDTWLPDQVASLQHMGNSKARAIYEARLPDNYRRPQTDSALEAFIRSKYEHKKYIAEEWIPPTSPPKATWVKDVTSPNASSIAANATSPAKIAAVKPKNKPEEPKYVIKDEPKRTPVPVAPQSSIPKSQSLMDDLLSLDIPDPQPVQATTKNATSMDALDIFGLAPSLPAAAASTPVLNAGQSLNSLTSLLSTPMGQAGAQNGAEAPGKMTKESILALYQKTPIASSFPVAGFPAGAFAQPTNLVNPMGMGMTNGFAPSPVPQQQGYSQSLLDQMKKLGMNAPVAPPNQVPPSSNFGFPAFGVQPQPQPQPQSHNPLQPGLGTQWGTSAMLPSGPASFPFGALGATPSAPPASYGQTTSTNLWQ